MTKWQKNLYVSLWFTLSLGNGWWLDGFARIWQIVTNFDWLFVLSVQLKAATKHLNSIINVQQASVYIIQHYLFYIVTHSLNRLTHSFHHEIRISISGSMTVLPPSDIIDTPTMLQWKRNIGPSILSYLMQGTNTIIFFQFEKNFSNVIMCMSSITYTKFTYNWLDLSSRRFLSIA